MNKKLIMSFCALFYLLVCVSACYAETAPAKINYHGFVKKAGGTVDGNGYFKFAIVNNGGTTTYWSNADVDASGVPNAAVLSTVSSGVFNVVLGDTGQNTLSKSIFGNGETLHLRVWFCETSGGTFEEITPKRELSSVAYAINADTFNSTTQTSLTLDSDSTAATNIDIVAKQGSAGTVDGTLRYNATTGKWQISNAGGAFSDIGTGGGSGTVTSVGLSLPAEITVTNSPVTTTGTLTGAWASEAANTVFAAPDGSAGTPAFRALTATDIPSLAASKITSGTLAVAQGGTNKSSWTQYSIPYASDTTTIAEIAPAASSVLVTSGANVPSLGTDIPTAVTIGTKYIYRADGTDVPVADGGTGASSAATARSNLSAAASGANGDITSLTGLNTQGALVIGPYGAAAGNTSEIRFLELAAGGTEYVGFKAPDAITTSKIWTLPSADGSSGQFLKTDGSLALSWAAASISSLTIDTGLPYETSVGYQAGNSNTGDYNTFVGFQAGLENITGNQNTASGCYALRSNTAGIQNTASGYYALYSNTTGNYNTASGCRALWSNTTGNYNTASGYYALSANTIGVDNTASGAYALYLNTTGTDNTASGFYALSANTIGIANTASGSNALLANTTGSYNTASGSSALFANTIGTNNTASGRQALYTNTAGYQNTANGASALYSNTSGTENTASGHQALYANTTGYQNTACGIGALNSNTIGYENTAIGRLALNSNTTGYINTACGGEALYANTTGRGNTAIGYQAGDTNTTGTYNTFVGYFADADAGTYTNATAIGNGAIVTANNKVRIGDSNVTVIEGQVDWTFISDLRTKKNITDNDIGLEFILGLRPVHYEMKEGHEGIIYDGFIAQEVEDVMDKLGVTFSGLKKPNNPDDMYTISLSTFVVPLVNAIKEQQEQIEKLKQEIELLKQKKE